MKTNLQETLYNKYLMDLAMLSQAETRLKERELDYWVGTGEDGVGFGVTSGWEDVLSMSIGLKENVEDGRMYYVLQTAVMYWDNIDIDELIELPEKQFGTAIEIVGEVEYLIKNLPARVEQYLNEEDDFEIDGETADIIIEGLKEIAKEMNDVE